MPCRTPHPPGFAWLDKPSKGDWRYLLQLQTVYTNLVSQSNDFKYLARTWEIRKALCTNYVDTGGVNQLSTSGGI